MTAKKVPVPTLLALALAAVLAACGMADRDQTAGQRYHCPMHTTYISDEPGDCPICGMALVPIKDDQAPAVSSPKPAADGDKIAQVEPGRFYCPMGAEHVQDGPGNCPKCGMPLVQKQE